MPLVASTLANKLGPALNEGCKKAFDAMSRDPFSENLEIGAAMDKQAETFGREMANQLAQPIAEWIVKLLKEDMIVTSPPGTSGGPCTVS